VAAVFRDDESIAIKEVSGANLDKIAYTYFPVDDAESNKFSGFKVKPYAAVSSSSELGSLVYRLLKNELPAWWILQESMLVSQCKLQCEKKADIHEYELQFEAVSGSSRSNASILYEHFVRKDEEGGFARITRRRILMQIMLKSIFLILFILVTSIGLALMGVVSPPVLAPLSESIPETTSLDIVGQWLADLKTKIPQWPALREFTDGILSDAFRLLILLLIFLLPIGFVNSLLPHHLHFFRKKMQMMARWWPFSRASLTSQKVRWLKSWRGRLWLRSLLLYRWPWQKKKLLCIYWDNIEVMSDADRDILCLLSGLANKYNSRLLVILSVCDAGLIPVCAREINLKQSERFSWLLLPSLKNTNKPETTQDRQYCRDQLNLGLYDSRKTNEELADHLDIGTVTLDDLPMLLTVAGATRLPPHFSVLRRGTYDYAHKNTPETIWPTLPALWQWLDSIAGSNVVPSLLCEIDELKLYDTVINLEKDGTLPNPVEFNATGRWLWDRRDIIGTQPKQPFRTIIYQPSHRLIVKSATEPDYFKHGVLYFGEVYYLQMAIYYLTQLKKHRDHTQFDNNYGYASLALTSALEIKERAENESSTDKSCIELWNERLRPLRASVIANFLASKHPNLGRICAELFDYADVISDDSKAYKDLQALQEGLHYLSKGLVLHERLIEPYNNPEWERGQFVAIVDLLEHTRQVLATVACLGDEQAQLLLESFRSYYWPKSKLYKEFFKTFQDGIERHKPERFFMTLCLHWHNTHSIRSQEFVDLFCNKAGVSPVAALTGLIRAVKWTCDSNNQDEKSKLNSAIAEIFARLQSSNNEIGEPIPSYGIALPWFKNLLEHWPEFERKFKHVRQQWESDDTQAFLKPPLRIVLRIGYINGAKSEQESKLREIVEELSW